jgi:hypothetical protein
MEVYNGKNVDGEVLETIKVLGTYFQLVFLLINTVLMLNFVIAILSSTFNKYENIKIGLYYNVLIELFDKLSWDDKFGCLICAQQPLNILLSFFSPLMVIFSNDEEKL